MKNTTDIPFLLEKEIYRTSNFPKIVFESPNFENKLKKAQATIIEKHISDAVVEFSMAIPPGKADFIKEEIRLLLKKCAV